MLNADYHLCQTHWFYEVIICTFTHGPNCQSDIGLPSQHKDRDIRMLRNQLREILDSVLHRHYDVQENQIELFFL